MRCRGTTSDGTPCQQFAMKGSQYCYAHDPRKAEERQRSSSRAVRARTNGRLTVDAGQLPNGGRLDTLEDIAAMLRWLSKAVLTGTIDARTCREAKDLVRELRPTLQSIEEASARREIEELRETLEDLKAGRGGSS